MEKIFLNAYLTFNGNCKEAMEFYKVIFGGNLSMMTFGQADPNASDSMKDKIMHSDLMGSEIEFMACDNPSGGDVSTGNVGLALHGNDEAKLRKIFDDLSVGGSISVPLEMQMWGDLFGSVKDKFGMEWMVNIGGQKK